MEKKVDKENERKKKEKERRKRENKNTRHHIIPSSRGGSSKLENIAGIKLYDHRAYHYIFDNKTPDEIIRCLVDEYWNGQVYHVDKFYETYYNDYPKTKKEEKM